MEREKKKVGDVDPNVEPNVDAAVDTVVEVTGQPVKNKYYIKSIKKNEFI
jgi:hypothetical protein